MLIPHPLSCTVLELAGVLLFPSLPAASALQSNIKLVLSPLGAADEAATLHQQLISQSCKTLIYSEGFFLLLSNS